MDFHISFLKGSNVMKKSFSDCIIESGSHFNPRYNGGDIL